MSTLLDQNLHSLVVESLPVGVCVVNMEGKICLWSAGAERLTGYLRQEILGRHCQDEFFEHIDVEQDPHFTTSAPLLHSIKEGRAGDTTASLRGKYGDFIAVEIHIVPLRDAQNAMQGAMEIFVRALPAESFTNRRQSKLAGIGCLDALTGMLNHSMIQAHLHESLNLLHVYPIPFCVVCLGIDGIGKLRERYGQAAVDATLRAVSQTIENALRPTDFVGRWLDQEFLAILTECSSNEVVKVCQRVARMASHAPISWWGESLHVTLSMGATPALDHDTVGSIVGRAELALRDCMERGGNQVVLAER